MTADWFDDFSRLQSRYVIEGRLVARTGFRVGAGRAHGEIVTDLPVLLDGKGALFLPGSSLKGVVRSAAERLLRSLANEGHAEEHEFACDPLDHGGCLRGGADAGSEERVASSRDIWQTLQRKACLACATFGGLGLASHARFFDASAAQPARAMVRDGVALDRDLGRASDGKKFDYEVGPAGTSFGLRVELENARPWQAGLVVWALDEVDRGSLRVGGFGSRGLGSFALEGRTIRKLALGDVLRGQGGSEEQPDALLTSLWGVPEDVAGWFAAAGRGS